MTINLTGPSHRPVAEQSAPRSDHQPTPAKRHAAGPPRRWHLIIARWALAWVALLAVLLPLVVHGHDGSRPDFPGNPPVIYDGSVIAAKQAALDDELAAEMTRYHCTPPDMWRVVHPDTWDLPNGMIIKPDGTFELRTLGWRYPAPGWTMALCEIYPGNLVWP